jgi:hypothetical protein
LRERTGPGAEALEILKGAAESALEAGFMAGEVGEKIGAHRILVDGACELGVLAESSEGVVGGLKVFDLAAAKLENAGFEAMAAAEPPQRCDDGLE